MTWPHISVTINTDQSAHVYVAGVEVAAFDPTDNIYQETLKAVADISRQYRRPLPVDAHTPLGHWHMTVHPDGSVTEEPSLNNTEEQPPQRRQRTRYALRLFALIGITVLALAVVFTLAHTTSLIASPTATSSPSTFI